MNLTARGLVTALRTLTLLPVPGREAATLAESLPFFPWVGALVGGIVVVGLWACCDLLGWPLGGGVLGAFLAATVTRGLHADGLADSADGLMGGSTPERRLAIMKDPNVGAFGVLALVLSLMMKAAALTRLANLSLWWWVLPPFVASRTMQVIMASTLPYARAEGGTAAAFVAGASRGHLLAATVAGAALCVGCAGAGGGVLLGLSALASLGVGRSLRRRIGGVTGDTLGLTSELCETGGLFLVAMLAPWLAWVDWRVLRLWW
jgi:adenosylcobinamide-GDP ribazoletransferase